jgi:two-component system LytT family sensor kinase
MGRRVRITRERLATALAIHACAGAIVAALHCLAAATIRYGLIHVSGFEPQNPIYLQWLTNFKQTLLFNFEWEVLIYGGVVALSHAIQLNRELQARELNESRLKARLVEARLESLQRQLHPHFLFNTLHAIAGLVHRDADAAEAMIVRLGELLRAVFRSDVQQEVPLARELELAEQYLDIQRVRFGTALTTDVDVPRELRGAPVPVLVLQPLVENAIKHGFARRPTGGVIRIRARQTGERLDLTVADNGRGVTADALRELNEGVGLSNTRARLEHLYPGRHALVCHPSDEGGFAVTISLPVAAAVPAEDVNRLGVPA